MTYHNDLVKQYKDMTRGELAEIYNSYIPSWNKLTGSTKQTIKSFKDHPTAVARTADIVADVTKLRDAEHKAKPEKKATKREKVVRNFKGIVIRKEYRPDHDVTRLPLPGHMRYESFELLRRPTGATWDELIEIVTREGKSNDDTTIEQRAYRRVLDMWYQYGYGIRQDHMTGRLYIFR